MQKPSKRVPLKRKYNIEKRASEHRRHLKKAAKLVGATKRYKRKDPGIPNLWPWKGEMIDEFRQQREAEREQRAAELKAVAAAAAQKGKAFEERAESAAEDADAGTPGAAAAAGAAVNSTAAFRKTVESLLRDADVVIEVLDVRSPLVCHSADVAQRVADAGKRLVLVLNKVDLVPREVAAAWQAHFAASHPTVLLKAGSRRLARSGPVFEHASAGELAAAGVSVGGGALLELLKTYSRDAASGVVGSLRVAVVGKPNVGKSSVIAALCAARGNRGVGAGAAFIGAEPGVTRRLQEIALDSKVRLFDSPGVIVDGSENDPLLILSNAVKLGTVRDPVEVVSQLVQMNSAVDLMKSFAVPFFQSPAEFLAHVAAKKGRLARGGAVDYNAAARAVLQDWTSGRVRHWTLPPQAAATATATAATAAGDAGNAAQTSQAAAVRLVTALAPEFVV